MQLSSINNTRDYDLKKQYMKEKIKIVLIIIALILFMALPAAIVKYYSDGGNFFITLVGALKVLGAFLGISSAVTLPIYFIGLLIEKAVDTKNGKIYNLVEIINGISILTICLISLYFTIKGLILLSKEHIFLFIGFICAVAFSGYYWYKKKGN